MAQKYLVVPARLDSAGVLEYLNQLAFLENDEQPSETIAVDAAWLGFAHPIGIVVVVNSLTAIQERWPGMSISMRLPVNQDVKDYLARMNVFQRLRINYNEHFVRHNAGGRFVELSEIEDEDKCGALAQEIGVIFERKCSLNKSQVIAIQTAIAEVAENVFHHSESQTLGLVAAQFYPYEKLIRIAICDHGIGIHQALTKSERFKHLVDNPEESLRTAIRYKTTSTPDRNSGYGLYVTTEIIRRSGSVFSIHTQDRKMIGRNNGLRISQVPTWQGTIVNLGFRSDVSYSVNEIYDGMKVGEDLNDTVDELMMQWNIE